MHSNVVSCYLSFFFWEQLLFKLKNIRMHSNVVNNQTFNSDYIFRLSALKVYCIFQLFGHNQYFDSNATLVLSVDSQLYIWTGCSVASRQYACGVLSIHSNLIFHKHMEWYKFIGIWKSSLIISWDYESGRNIIIVLHKRMCTREFIISPHQWHKNLLSHR